eukprot:TCONS_00057384-protein
MAALLSETKRIVCIRLAIVLFIASFSILFTSLDSNLLLNAGVGLWAAGFITLSSILLLIPLARRTCYVLLVHLNLSILGTLTGIVVNAFTLRKLLWEKDYELSLEACTILLGVTLVLMCIEIFISIYLICSSFQKTKSQGITLLENKGSEAKEGLLLHQDQKFKET